MSRPPLLILLLFQILALQVFGSGDTEERGALIAADALRWINRHHQGEQQRGGYIMPHLFHP